MTNIYFLLFWSWAQGAGRARWGPSLGPQTSQCVLTPWKWLGSSLEPLYKSINFVHEALPSWRKHLPKTPPPNTITLGIGVSRRIWGEHRSQSVAATFAPLQILLHTAATRGILLRGKSVLILSLLPIPSGILCTHTSTHIPSCDLDGGIVWCHLLTPVLTSLPVDTYSPKQ